MIYDADTWIGHWPFRSLPKKSAADLLREMDKHGIDKALVASLHGLFYTDAHEANRELVKEIRRSRDRLVPCAVINPAYYGWQQDLRQCREEFGMPVVRLTPDYHNYPVQRAAAIVEAAHELKMLVAFVGRVIDTRGRNWLDPGREAKGDELAALIEKYPKASFLLLNFAEAPQGKRWDKPACFLDTVRFQGGNGERMPRALEKYGPDRLVFGSTLLLRYAKPALLALEVAPLTKTQRERILWRNLAGLIPELR